MRQFIREPKRIVRYHLIPGQNNPERLRRADDDIISGRNPVMRALSPLGFRFKKTLGQGGGGIALLVDLLDQNGQTDQWVVKVPVGESKLGREARNMRVSIIYDSQMPFFRPQDIPSANHTFPFQSMVGARHIVQRKFIQSSGQDAPENQAKLNTDDDDCTYGMELLKHGSVDRLLRKVSAQDLKLRDDELWMIFHCRE